MKNEERAAAHVVQQPGSLYIHEDLMIDLLEWL